MSQNESASAKSGLNVTLISDKEMFSLWLAYPAKGRFYFTDDKEERISSHVFFDGSEDGWHIHASAEEEFIGLRGETFNTALVEDQFIAVYQDEAEGQCLIYAEQADQQSAVFHNYKVDENVNLRIGRANDNDIIYHGALMSRHDAVLSYRDNVFSIHDNKSANGLFINGNKYQEKSLQLGDSLYIMGLRIVIGCGFISINDESRLALINTSHLRRVTHTSEILKYPGEDKVTVREKSLFNRYPRKMLPMPVHDIVIEGPPMSMNGNHIPLLMQVGSPLAMGAASILSGFANPAYLATSLAFPLMNAGYSEKQRKDYEERRIKFYTKYLTDKEKEIEDEKAAEEESLRLNYPELNTVLKYAVNNRHKLWERRKEDKDFLKVRIGSGDLPLRAQISFPRERFQLDQDALEEEMRKLGSKEVLLNNVPVMLDLLEDFAVGVQGSRKMIMYFIQSFTMRIAELYSYDEVKMVFLCTNDELNQIEFIKYLPHCFDDSRSVRFIAAEENDAIQLGQFLKNELESHLDQEYKSEIKSENRPYYIVFSLNKILFDRMEILKQAINRTKSAGLSLIAFYEDLPKECSLLLNLQDDGINTITYLKDPEKPDYVFEIDPVLDKELARESLYSINNTMLKGIERGFSLPKSVKFLDMYKVGKIEHLNVLRRWKESNPVKSLAAPIGVGAGGQIFSLDLHQKSQGPHGIVAGMTGSGKSEFLITYILSMAVNYNPYDVSFLLIDYKGGGLAGAFDDSSRGIHLPHLIGTITNLDGATMQRSFIAIQSELLRRQRIFNKAKSISGEGTMDIYTYQRLYHAGTVEEPLPHLFIISDEFAELKQQQPEFMDQLISIARIGRSLGVHLILATQKPSGVVNDQIRSNTKFQVCLKVQDRNDSVDMLGKPDAAELKDTGRFYIQVGYHEYYEMGQAAWSGCDYIPQDESESSIDSSIDIIDNTAQILISRKPAVKASSVQGTQLTAIVKYLSDLAIEEKISPRQLWKEPLPRVLPYEVSRLNSCENEGIHAVIGTMDDPQNQAQIPFIVEIQKKSNLLIFGDQGSGKSTLLQTLILDLAEKYTPEDVNFYILDCSGRSLKVFNDLPHTGGALDEDQEQYIPSFFDLIDHIVSERKKLFMSQEVDTFESSCSLHKLPLIIIVIDNVSVFGNMNAGYKYYTKLDNYLKAGVAYGIRYIITANHLNDVSLRVKQELPYRIALHMKDRYEYSDALNLKCSYVPADNPGRGMAEYDGRALEMQISIFHEDAGKDRIQLLKNEVHNIGERNKSYRSAAVLPIIEPEQTYEDFCLQFNKNRIPLGYNLDNAKPVALPLKQFEYLSVYLGNKTGIFPIIKNFSHAFIQENLRVVLLKKKRNSVFNHEILSRVNPAREEDCYVIDENGMIQFAKRMGDELIRRNEVMESYCKEHGYEISRLTDDTSNEFNETYSFLIEHEHPLVIFVESFAELCRYIKEKQDNKQTAFAKKIMLLIGRSRHFGYKVMVCVYPGETAELSSDFYDQVWNKKTALLFGGQFDKQNLINPVTIDTPPVEIKYNIAVMSYRDHLYNLLMPCGKLIEDEENEDDQPIF